MIALLFAAHIVGAPPIQSAADLAAENRLANGATVRVYRKPPRTLIGETPNLYSVPARCRTAAQPTVLQVPRGRVPPVPAAPVPSLSMRLAQLPPAYLEYAVNRTVAGCPVPTYVRDNGQPIRSR